MEEFAAGGVVEQFGVGLFGDRGGGVAEQFRDDRTKRCGDFYLDEPPPDVGVREPRRPRPQAPGGAALLELPQTDLGWGIREYHFARVPPGMYRLRLRPVPGLHEEIGAQRRAR